MQLDAEQSVNRKRANSHFKFEKIDDRTIAQSMNHF
jgi:hypothetical protein